MVDISGQQFGRLTALNRVRVQLRNCEAWHWNYRCECGREKVLRPDRARKWGHCGCRAKYTFEGLSNPVRFVKHGMSGTPEHNLWKAINDRCHNPRAKDFPRYGGRGIKVCSRWRNSFENFFADMGKRPPGMSIERRRNNGMYSPRNCRWATPAEQADNTRRTRRLRIGKQTKTVTAWSKEAGVAGTTIRTRLYRGWTPREAVFTPADRRRHPAESV